MFIVVTIAILLGLGLILLLNRFPSPIAAEKAYYQPRDVEQRRLEQLTLEQFERLCIQLLEQLGLTVTHCHRNARGEIDINAVNPHPVTGGSYIIRCIFTQPEVPVNSTQIISLSTTVLAERALKGIFITTGFFSEEVSKLTEGPPIELINGGRLGQILEEHRISLT
jgi:restriction endonuclease Mrr